MTLCVVWWTGGCSFDPPGANGDGNDGERDAAVDSAPQPDSGIPAFRKRIEVSPMAAGLTLTADVTDMPIAVILDADAELMERALTDGADIVFTAVDNTTLLPHEIEQFDKSTGKLVAWVRLPVVPMTGSTTIFMYYGFVGATDRQDLAGTWANDYAGVWHMVASPVDGITNEYLDSGPRQNRGTASGNNRPMEVAGIVGPGQLYDGSNGNPDAIQIPDPAGGDLDFGTSSFSWSAWVHVTQSAGDFDFPWFKGGAVSTQPGYNFSLGRGTWRANMADGSDLVDLNYGDEVDLLGEDVFLTAVVDRAAGALRGYLNGVPLPAPTDISSFGSIDTDLEVRLGGLGEPFKGVLDEVRVYSIPLTDEQVAIEHANIANKDTFLTVGDEEPTAYP